jgi:hypothetical protein
MATDRQTPKSSPKKSDKTAEYAELPEAFFSVYSACSAVLLVFYWTFVRAAQIFVPVQNLCFRVFSVFRGDCSLLHEKKAVSGIKPSGIWF